MLSDFFSKLSLPTIPPSPHTKNPGPPYATRSWDDHWPKPEPRFFDSSIKVPKRKNNPNSYFEAQDRLNRMRARELAFEKQQEKALKEWHKFEGEQARASWYNIQRLKANQAASYAYWESMNEGLRSYYDEVEKNPKAPCAFSPAPTYRGLPGFEKHFNEAVAKLRASADYCVNGGSTPPTPPKK